MLPVATAANAIAYGTGKVRTQDMVREGAVLSVLASLIIAGMSWLPLAPDCPVTMSGQFFRRGHNR